MSQTLIIVYLLILNFFILFFINKLTLFYNIYDHPNSERKFHKEKTSLFGGTIILINIIFFFILNFLTTNTLIDDVNILQFLSGALLFYFLGLADDKLDISSNLKFFYAIIISCLIILIDDSILIEKLVFASLDLTVYLGNYSFIFTLICIIIFINALNMFDGINLQSGTYSLLIISSLFLFSSEKMLLISINISLLIFLYLNFKSKVFLGDSGTHMLGFIISFLVIKTAKIENYSLLTADQIFLIMILPGLELVRLFFQRILKKKHPFSPDRNHIHHILLKHFSQLITLFILNLLSIVPILYIIFFNNNFHVVIILFIIIYSIIIKKYKNSEQ